MHGNNGKKGSGDSGFIPSDRYERYSGSNKEVLEALERQRREGSKPKTQLDSSSATSAGSSKGKGN